MEVEPPFCEKEPPSARGCMRACIGTLYDHMMYEWVEPNRLTEEVEKNLNG
jgi:hypothetical protein